MLFHRLTSLAGSIALYLSLGFCAAGADDASTLQRWLYCSQNLWVDKNIDELEALFRRAAKAGYTHVLLTDSKFSKLGDMDTRYFRNVERVKRWFAGRGHQQVIAGYYDHKPEQVCDWLGAAVGVEGVVGVMYTTWQRKYGDLEKFSELIGGGPR